MVVKEVPPPPMGKWDNYKKTFTPIPRRQLPLPTSEWYNLRPILGNANWALFYILLGARECGKSYAVTNFFVDQFVHRGIPFIWLRLTEEQSRILLQNNAEKLVDPDIRRKYNLDLTTNGTNVYAVTKRSAPDKKGKTTILEKKLFARVLSLSTFYKNKGSIFDKDFLKDPNMRYNVACDEFEREKNERKTFDIVYALTNQLENLLRSTKDRVKIFFMGNTLEEASDILANFNFIPEEFGIFKIKPRRCVIHYIPNSELYIKRRTGSIADILMPNASTFTNKTTTDNSLISKERLIAPSVIIKFSKDKADWFTTWNGGQLITAYHGEKKPSISMRPFIDDIYNKDLVNNIINIFDTRGFRYRNMIDFKRFQSKLEILRPSK